MGTGKPETCKTSSNEWIYEISSVIVDETWENTYVALLASHQYQGAVLV